MNKHNKLWFVASFIVLPLMLAACGGGSPGSIPDLSPLVDGRSEGSTGSPVQVTVGVDHSGSVGLFSTVAPSFYTFVTSPTTPPTTATIFLRDPLILLVWRLYSDPGFNNLVDTCSVLTVITVSCTTTLPLAASTRYYLSVSSVNPASDRYTLRVNQP